MTAKTGTKGTVKGELLGSLEFSRQRTQILAELKQLVCNDFEALSAILEPDYKLSFSQKRMTNKKEQRKWSLFLKYRNERDFEIEKLCYMELKKLFLLSEKA